MPDDLEHVVVRLEPETNESGQAVIYAEAGLADEDDVRGAVEYPIRIEVPLTADTERSVIEEHLDDVLAELVNAVAGESQIQANAAVLRRNVVFDLRL